MEELRKRISANMVKMRNAKELTQTEVARILGISRSNYVKMELGYCQVPAPVLFKLAFRYNITSDYFVSEGESPVQRSETMVDKLYALQTENDHLREMLRVFSKLNTRLEAELGVPGMMGVLGQGKEY